MQYDKTVKDTHDDTARVSAHDSAGNVDFWARQSLGDVGAYLDFTPSQARALAKALKRAANVAEGKPAKAKHRVIDGDGDAWEIDDNGLYYCPSATHMPGQTMDQIRTAYGIAGDAR